MGHQSAGGQQQLVSRIGVPDHAPSVDVKPVFFQLSADRPQVTRVDRVAHHLVGESKVVCKVLQGKAVE